MQPKLPEGKYVGRVLDHGLGISSNNNHQFVMRIVVLGRVDPANPNNYFPLEGNPERTLYRTLTDATIDWVLEEFRVLGFDGNSFAQLDTRTPGHQSFVGKEYDFICQHKPDQNKELREEWSLSRGSGLMLKQQATDEQIRQLDGIFGRRLRELRKDAPKTTAKSTPKPEPVGVGKQGVDDTDIPF